MKPPLFIRPHLGLGDALIINGLVRVKAREHEAVIVPCKAQNFQSVRFMWSDVPNITVVPVDGDGGAENMFVGFAGDKLRLGMFGEGFNFKDWDRKFYEQAGVGFDTRWSEFAFPYKSKPGFTRSIFVHEDRARGFAIDPERYPKENVLRPLQAATIFEWVPHLIGAQEIHCIDSSFAILADSMPDLAAKRLVIHLYARPGAKLPTYRKNWEILK